MADNFLGEYPVRVVKWPQQPTCQLGGGGKAGDTTAPPLLACAHARWVDVWRLGTEGEPPSSAAGAFRGAPPDTTVRASSNTARAGKGALGGRVAAGCRGRAAQ